MQYFCICSLTNSNLLQKKCGISFIFLIGDGFDNEFSMESEDRCIMTSSDSKYPGPDNLTGCPVTELPAYYEECAKNPLMDVSQRMKYEIIRYATFATLKKKCPIAFMKLSKAGFYHDVTSESIKCCQCGFVYKNIESNDDPMEIHSRNSPNCKFVKENYNNSHLVSGDSARAHPSDIGGAVVSGDSPRVHPFDIGVVSGDSPRVHPFDIGGAVVSGDSPRVHPSDIGGAVVSGDSPRVHPSDIGGTVVSGDSPRVHPSDIGGAIGGSSQIPHSSQQGNVTPCGNRTLMQTVPLQSLTENQPVSTERNNSSVTLSSPQQIQPASSQVIRSENQRRGVKSDMFKDLGICVEKPKYPKYAIFAKRRGSFKMWPKSNVVSPDDLSQAGFYYSGSKDRVHCFFCGGGLGEWERGDDPWIEHAHWFPNCPYVRQCKGDDFMTYAKVDVQSLKSEKDLFQTAAFQSLLEMGYTKEQIEKAYEQTKSEEMPISGEQLLELIWDTEDKRKEESQEKNQGARSKENPNQEIQGQHDKLLQQQTAEEKQENPDEPNKLDFKALATEYEDLKAQKICKVCMDEDAAVVFLPCGHMSTCVNCAPAMRSCPICRSFVKGTVKAILS